MKVQRVVEAGVELRRHDVVAQRCFGMRHAVGQLQDEVALMHLLRDRNQFSDQCHGCCLPGGLSVGVWPDVSFCSC
jgi:hypothetical protein